MKTKEENNSFGKAEKPSKRLEQKKSPIVLFWEKYPNGYAGGCEIINHAAVLR